MPNQKIAPEGRALLRDQLDTSDKLELVHTLRSAAQPMSPSELTATCRLAPDTLRESLASLTRLTIVEAIDDGTRFRVSPTTRASGIEALMMLYEDDRSIVLSELNELALEKIRGMAAETFAEALLHRKRGGRDD